MDSCFRWFLEKLYLWNELAQQEANMEERLQVLRKELSSKEDKLVEVNKKISARRLRLIELDRLSKVEVLSLSENLAELDEAKLKLFQATEKMKSLWEVACDELEKKERELASVEQQKEQSRREVDQLEEEIRQMKVETDGQVLAAAQLKFKNKQAKEESERLRRRIMDVS